MKMLTKLMLIVLAVSGMFIASDAAYFVLLAPMDIMESEAELLQKLSQKTANLQVQTSLLLAAPLGPQTVQFVGAIGEHRKTLSELADIRVLRQGSEEIADALNSLASLGDLTAGSLDSTQTALQELGQTIDELALDSETSTFLDVMKATSTQGEGTSALHMYRFTVLVSNIRSAEEALHTTRTVIDAKDAAIRTELEKLKATSTMVGLAIVVLALVGALLLSYFFTRNLTNTLKRLGETLAAVGGGDLRARPLLTRRDELGRLAKDIGQLTTSLTESVLSIQKGSARNVEVKDLLMASTQSATASAIQIEANSTSILRRLEEVGGRIQSSSNDMKGALKLLASLRKGLESTALEVSGARQAVDGLMEGVTSISRQAGDNGISMQDLLKKAEVGREVFDNAFARVGEIQESVHEIQEIVQVISDISSQTNILAMNAAIEAAHAGDAGRGFAVVSDEISKLAAASATSSSQITSTIRNIVAKIQEAGATRQETLETFDAINTQIRIVAQRDGVVLEQVQLMDKGASKIGGVMGDLAGTFQSTQEVASSVSGAIEKLDGDLSLVDRISTEVTANVGEITQGLGDISRSITSVSEQSHQLELICTQLDSAVNSFRT